MDLRVAAPVSLSRDDLRYNVGDPSRSRLIDLGDDGSLIGEDIGKSNTRLFLMDGCYEKSGENCATGGGWSEISARQATRDT